MRVVSLLSLLGLCHGFNLLNHVVTKPCRRGDSRMSLSQSPKAVPTGAGDVKQATPTGAGGIKPWATKVQETMDRENIEAMYLRHILVQTPEMATTVMEQIRAGADFEELASSLSDCAGTRSKGGAIGWASLGDEHLDEVLSPAAREAMLKYKPGDVATVVTERGVQIVRVEDVLTRLTTMKRRGSRLGGKGAPRVSTLASPSGEPGKYFMETMGCQMNVADSERIEGQLVGMGYESTDVKEDANLFVLNTCSIRDHAEQKVYSHVGPLAIRKHNGEDISIVVAGCVAQQEGEKLLRRVPEIDVIMGPQYANRLSDLLEDVRNGSQVVATDPTLISEDISKPKRGSTTSAWVNIIYGCIENCTYCVVPAVRGVEQSRPRESIKQEMEELAEQGYREVTLLGQNIDAYGRDIEPKQTFADLLHYVSKVKGIDRIRYVTSHPRYMSERVVSAIADLPNVCECFMVPFQSGDNTVLKNMRRGYTHESYMRIIDRIKKLSPDASICADVIVGFPGETDEQFQRTLDLMNKVKFDMLNSFTYSPRPNTEAAYWEDQVPEDVKSERLQMVQRLATQHAAERSERYLGREVEVLVEQRNVKNPNQVMGRNRQNRPVFFDGDIDELKGKLIMVKITETRPWSLTGEAAGDPY
ncbi:unnamed protein product [Chrysoparadoxa australica]